MTGVANKVAYGLKNVHYAPFKVGVDGTITYEKPKKYPGAVELTLDPKGELSEFFADDATFYTVSSNQGYEGKYTSAEIPEEFRVDVLGEEIIGGVIVEKANAKTKQAALLFEFDGDETATRHVLYNCTFSRPSISGKTKEDKIEVSTNELSFNAAPREDSLVKIRTGSATTKEVYDAWYDAVHIPTEIPAEIPTV